MTVHRDIHNLASATAATYRTMAPIHCSINFRQRKGNYLQTKTSSSNQKHQQTKYSHSTSKNAKHLMSIHPQNIQTCSRSGTTKFSNPSKSKQDKI